jgi:AcrR family transcriptional regulator
MEFHLQMKMNPKLSLRDPEQSELGRNIIRTAIRMMWEMGFEEFTFKKLALQIGTTEASIYRYFENKHKLLIYLTTWFWTWLEYQLVFHTNNLQQPTEKINMVIKLLTFQLHDQFAADYIDKMLLHQITVAEGDKAFLTKHVAEDNRNRLFKPYKDLCARIASIFREYQPGYKYAHSLSSTLIETAHHQIYFKDNLPSLTDFGGVKETEPVAQFLHHLVYSALTDKLS